MTMGEYLVTMKDMQSRAAIDAYRRGDELGEKFHAKSAEGFHLRLLQTPVAELEKEIGGESCRT